MRNCLLTLLLLFAAMTGAQTFRASALAGVNLSQIDGDDLLGFYQPGPNAGLRVVAILSERWRVGPELLYTQQGARRNRNSLNLSDFSRFRLNTIEIPLMVYYKDWRVTAEAGAAYQRLFGYTILDDRGEDVTAGYPLKQDLFSLQLGVTVYLTPRLGVNFRWSRHLADLQTAESPRLRGRTIALRAVYTLGTGETLPSSSSASPPPQDGY